MTPGVSRGILEALDAGVLTATSVMTTSPWWPELAPALQPNAGHASIGLHLNLTLGTPLGAMPRLAPQGTLPSIGFLVSRRGSLPLDEIAAEIERQLERFADIYGAPPDHLDGHQHVHVLGPILWLVLDALARRDWKPWVRDSSDRPTRILRRGSHLKKAMGVAVLGRGLRRKAKAAGLLTNDGFAGFSSFVSSITYGNEFRHYLKAPGQRHLVMCHPGYVDDALRRLDPVVERREEELAFLLSPAFQAMLAQESARLTRLDGDAQTV